jgi:hypothetical protein
MSVKFIINAVLDALGIPPAAPPETIVEIPKAKLEEALIAAVPAEVAVQLPAKRKARKAKPKTKPRKASRKRR